MISSRLDFCNSLFYGLNSSCINKLQKVQNAAVRLITKKSKRDSVLKDLRELHWLRVEERIWYKILLRGIFSNIHEIS